MERNRQKREDRMVRLLANHTIADLIDYDSSMVMSIKFSRRISCKLQFTKRWVIRCNPVGVQAILSLPMATTRVRRIQGPRNHKMKPSRALLSDPACVMNMPQIS